MRRYARRRGSPVGGLVAPLKASPGIPWIGGIPGIPGIPGIGGIIGMPCHRGSFSFDSMPDTVLESLPT